MIKRRVTPRLADYHPAFLLLYRLVPPGIMGEGLPFPLIVHVVIIVA